jgi:hypothetical protein
MEEENKQEKGQNDVSSQEQSVSLLAKALQEQKANSIPKEEYQKLQEDYKQLVDVVINGSTANAGANEPKADIEKLKSDFNSSEPKTNLQKWQEALALRKAIIEDGGIDPFVPQGRKYVATEDDYASAERIAKVVEETIEESQGDSEVFTALLMSKTADNPSVQAKPKGR